MASRDRRVAVAGEDHLPLLGDFEVARDRARRLGADCAIGGPAAAPQRSAAAVEQDQPETALLRPRSEGRLCVVQRDGRRRRPDLLRGIGVTEHHLDPAAVGREAPAHRPQLEHLVHHRGRSRQVGLSLK